MTDQGNSTTGSGVRPLRVLVTACGSPGGARLVRALQENGERRLDVVGTDMSGRRGGRIISQSFHVVPPGSSPEFIPTLVELAHREGVDAVLPSSSFEVAAIAEAVELFPMPVLVPTPSAIAAANDKSRTTEIAERLGIPVPRSIVATTPDELRLVAAELGYPKVDVCMKPTSMKGSRGFLVISARPNRRWHILEARPGPLPLTLDETVEAICSEGEFPSLLVMEYIQGPEHTVDGICRRPHDPGTRQDPRSGPGRPRDVLRNRPSAGTCRGLAGAGCRARVLTGS